MKKVAIIDYGLCNLDSVARAVEECGGESFITDQARELELTTHIILPGVGAFADAMQNLKKHSLDRAIYEQVVDNQIPFLGICLGMQLLAKTGWEGKETPGLGLIDGEVKRLEPFGNDTRIPHIGWNEVHFTQKSPLFEEIPSGKDYYFVHSYHFVCKDEKNVLARTPYCNGFTSAIGSKLIFGVQFHPEKSQRLGFQVIKNFLSI